MCPKHSRDDAPECPDCRTLSRFTPALIEIRDSKDAQRWEAYTDKTATKEGSL